MNRSRRTASETPTEVATIESQKTALQIAQLALDKKATDLVVLDIRPLAAYTEFVVVCSGSSDRQVAALAQSIDKSMSQAGVKCRGIEGKESGRWVLMDYGDVVVHVFYDPIRHLYDIEGLWPDAGNVKVPGYDRKRDVGYAQFA